MKKRKSNPSGSEKQTTDTPAQTDAKSEPPIPEERIRLRAYEIYQIRGGKSGHEVDDWLLAEIELKAEAHIR